MHLHKSPQFSRRCKQSQSKETPYNMCVINITRFCYVSTTIYCCNPIRISYIICYVLKLPSLTASLVCTKPRLHDIVYLHRALLEVFSAEMCLYTFEYRLLLVYLAPDIVDAKGNSRDSVEN